MNKAQEAAVVVAAQEEAEVEEVKLVRVSDAKILNRIVNHASVWPLVALAGQPRELDLSPIAENPANIVLVCEDERGGFVFHQHEPGVYEVHTQFVEGARGARVVVAAKKALELMFTATDAMELQTKVPSGNKGALSLVHAIHGVREFTRVGAWPTPSGEVWDVDYYTLHYARWVQFAEGLEAHGQGFHAKLVEEKARVGFPSEPDHPDDSAHDRAVGACARMIERGQVYKGIMLYNRWARFAGYLPVRVVSTNPLLLDIMSCFLWVRPDGGFEVMPCH